MHYTVTPLLVGVRNVDQGIMTYQQGYGKRIWLPMYSFLLRPVDGAQPGPKVILVDTGLEDFVTPPEFTAETGLEPKLMADALADHGLTPDDVDVVINTHLHDDHCGNNPLFPNATVHVQQKELDAALNPHPLDYRYDESFVEGLNIQTHEGDAEIAPGIRVIHTPGHTPGAQTVVVDTPQGPAVITGMCSNNTNYPATGPAVCPGVHCDAFQAYETAQRIRSMGGIRLPLHELTVAKKRIE